MIMERFFDMAKKEGLRLYNVAWKQNDQGGSVITHEAPRNVFSVTKMLTAIAVGFAVEEGRLYLRDRVVVLCPELLPFTAAGAEEITVYHLLTMTHGHGRGLLMPGQKERFFEKNYAALFMKEPLAAHPGERFVYCNGASYLLGYIVQRLVGQPLSAYLDSRLFAPLGISRPEWQTCPMGYETGGQGLFLRTPDMLLLGDLFLQNGGGLLSPSWVAAMTQNHIPSDWAGEGSFGYGYQLWHCQEKGAFRAEGTMGQFIWMDPSLRLVVAVQAEEPQCASGNEPFYRILRKLVY